MNTALSIHPPVPETNQRTLMLSDTVSWLGRCTSLELRLLIQHGLAVRKLGLPRLVCLSTPAGDTVCDQRMGVHFL